jgi:geranylgeranyl reductase family protein
MMEMPENPIYEMIIVGAGPAGTTAALRARELGLNVLLVDKKKFPRDKVCGDGQSGKTVSYLKKLNLIDALEASQPYLSDAVLFSSPGGQNVNIDFKQSAATSKTFGYVIPRFDFDHFLLEQAKAAGATVLEETSFRKLLRDEVTNQVGGIEVQSKSGETQTYHAPLVIGADGFGSKVAGAIDAANTDLKNTIVALRGYYKNVKDTTRSIELHFIKEIKMGYFWIFPLGDGRANVGLGARKDILKKHKLNLNELLDKVIDSKPFRQRFTQAEPEGDIKGWNLPIGNTWRKNYDDGVLLTGDAAGLVDPFTGEGIGNAMASGYLAANLAYKSSLANRYDKTYLQEYDIELRKLIQDELKTSSAMQSISAIQPLINLVVGKAAKNPELQALISDMIANEDAKSELKSPWFYLSLLFK